MYPMEEVDPYMPQEPPAWLLKKTLGKRKPEVQSAGGALTDTVQPAQPMLPNSVERFRQMAADFNSQGSKLMDQEPDMAPMQAYAKQRGQQGDAAMLNALAAQYAGDSFEPIQAQYLKRAAAAKDPLKMGSGYITPEGQYLKDPEVAQNKKAEFLLNQAKAYETLAQTSQDKQTAAEALRLQNETLNQLRQVMATNQAQFRQQQLDMQRLGLGIQQQGLDLRRAAAGGGGVGTGTAQQIGSGANNEPVFRPSKGGALFTYDGNGNAVPYNGPVNPKVSNAQPTEDERKAAGWFNQANNALRNVQGVLLRNGKASMPTFSERVAGFVPKVGEDLANSLRSEDRQQFVQAAGSFAEAALRAATGAGVNIDEARQKVAELTPQINDKPGTIKQKMDSWQVYMDSLKARAGRALPQNTPGAAPIDDPLGLRGR